MVRHKRIVKALDTGESEDWNEDHISDYTDEVRHTCIIPGIPLSVEWDFGQVVGGVNPTLVFEDHHVFGYLNTGGVTGQISSMRHEFDGAAGNITYIDDAPILTTAIWMEAYHTAGLVAEFGLIDSATAAAFTANQDGAYFRIDGNKLYAVTGDGAAETATDITPELGIPEYGHYRIHLQATKCDFYVDDMKTVAGSNTNNLPNNDLTIKYSIQSQNNVDSNMYIDGMGLTRLRYKG